MIAKLPDKPKELNEQINKLRNEMFTDHWSQRIPENIRADYRDRLARSLGRRYADCSLSNFRIDEETTSEERPSQRQVLEQVQAFASDAPARLAKGGGVVLFGKPGTGKDHLLSALAFWIIEHYGFTVKWTGGPELYSRARDRIREDLGLGTAARFIDA